MNVSLKVQMQSIPAMLQKDITRIDELWQEGLNRFGGEFLAGNSFTAVDAFFAPVALRIETYQLKLSEPVLAYAARLRALPAVQEWIEAGQLEPRHEAHELACLRHGKVEGDMRIS
ncbi:glutathione S-transferase C-terminal domain-containing protein [Alkanindiges illinoisensis]|uniref:glutathione S-transferase C-terminal domain-containing protein n=1 Tax=Alkanindiges illinoisensis TaxID=197183 RepID=UPI001B800088|nr:glutathione S-transferase C-terminal domain-containing protein [Alkanindiges illinoisensis]